MKEKMAGPGDTYAKDTRAYNPEFAAAAGDEDEYDKKIQEVSGSVTTLSFVRNVGIAETAVCAADMAEG